MNIQDEWALKKHESDPCLAQFMESLIALEPSACVRSSALLFPSYYSISEKGFITRHSLTLAGLTFLQNERLQSWLSRRNGGVRLMRLSSARFISWPNLITSTLVRRQRLQNQGCFLLRGAEDQVIHVDGLEEPAWAPGILGRLTDVKIHR